jgi:hypothetical protein
MPAIHSSVWFYGQKRARGQADRGAKLLYGQGLSPVFSAHRGGECRHRRGLVNSRGHAEHDEYHPQAPERSGEVRGGQGGNGHENRYQERASVVDATRDQPREERTDERSDRAQEEQRACLPGGDPDRGVLLDGRHEGREDQAPQEHQQEERGQEDHGADHRAKRLWGGTSLGHALPPGR